MIFPSLKSPWKVYPKSYLIDIGKIGRMLFIKSKGIHIVNNILSSENHPSKVGWYFCESLSGGDAVDNFSNAQEDGSVIFNEDLLILMVKYVNFSKMIETSGRFGSG